MAKLVWDQAGERLYQTGDKNMALFVFNSTAKTIDGETTNYYNGVAWNGITAVTESPSGAEPTDLWADDTKYATMRSAEQFGGTIEAYTYPDAWEQCDGSITTNGVTIGQQARKAFGLAYITTVGNDTELNDYGEKLHLVYNATANPSERSYATINDSPEAITFSWEFTTTPIDVGEGYKKASLITIDTTKKDANGNPLVDPAKYALFKQKVFGSDSRDEAAGGAYLPLPADVIAFFGGSSMFEYTAVDATEVDDWDYTYYQYFTKSGDVYNQIGVLNNPPMKTNATPTTGYGPYIGPYYKQSIDDGQT